MLTVSSLGDVCNYYSYQNSQLAVHYDIAENSAYYSFNGWQIMVVRIVYLILGVHKY